MSQLQQKSPDFRPDPGRALYITRQINGELLSELIPKIVKLKSGDAKPITLYIDSPGGDPRAAGRIFQILATPTQDSAASPRIITVGLSRCASAAADMLIAGNYALASQNCLIHCHGTRRSAADAVTREKAMSIAQELALDNEEFAQRTAKAAIGRFIFRYIILRPSFAAIRATRKKAGEGDISNELCFVYALKNHLSESAFSESISGIADDAIIWHFDNELAEFDYLDIYDNAPEGTNPKELEAKFVKSLIDRMVEFHADDEGWSLTKSGLDDLTRQIHNFASAQSPDNKLQIDMLIDRWGNLLLTDEQRKEVDAAADAQRRSVLMSKVGRTIRSIWSIFLGICRRLQQSENFLTAEDAYWLGLIDEVIGRADLPSFRLLIEFAPEEIPSKQDAIASGDADSVVEPLPAEFISADLPPAADGEPVPAPIEPAKKRQKQAKRKARSQNR